MPHQLSTAHDGAGETYDDSTTLVAGTHTQALFLRASTAFIGALSSGSKFIGSVALTSGSSGAVIGQVAPSSAWSLGLSTEFIGALSSGSKFIGSVALTSGSSGAVLGQVAPSSAWSLGLSTEFIGALSSGGKFVGIVALSSGSSGTQLGQVGISSGTITLSSGLAGSTASIGALSSGGVFIGLVALTSGSSGNAIGSVAPTSKWTLGPSTESIGALSSGGVFIGIVAVSSGTVTLTSGSLQLGSVVPTSGTLTLGTLTTGTIVGLTTTSNVGLTTGINYVHAPSTAGIASANFGTHQIGGQVSYAGTNATISSGNIAPLAVDSIGRAIVQSFGARGNIKMATLVTAANTSQQQLLAGTAAATYNDILFLEISSTAGALSRGTFLLFSSSGQAEPGQWLTSLSTGSVMPYQVTWPGGLIDPSTQPWFCYSTQAARFTVQYVVATT